MPVDIGPLIENSHDIFSIMDIDVGLSPSTCHKYVLNWSHPCTIDGTSGDTMYLDAQFLNYSDEEYKEVQTNRDGVVKKLFHRITPVLRLEFVVNDFFFKILKLVGLHDEIIISPINPSGPDFEIDPNSWEVERIGDETEDTYACRVTFKVKDSSLISKPCCDDSSIVSFEDPCDIGDGPGGEIPDPCVDYDVSISYDGSSLTADVTGGPASATITYQWYLNTGNGIFTPISTAGALNPVTPGIYRVVATRGTCQMSYDYDFGGDCLDYEVTLTEVAGPVLVASVNRFSTFAWYKDTGSGYVVIPGETNSYLVPDESADYKVIATSIGCEAEDEVTVVIDVCAHTVEVTRDNNILTAEVTGNTGTPTYQWYADFGDGMGSVLISGATAPTLAVTAPGCYKVKVTADGCDVWADYLILDVCVGFDVLIESVTPDGGSGVNITAAAVNPPGAVTYVWYQIVNGVFQQIGTGITVNTSLTGTVKVVATSGDCEVEEMTSFCVDPGSLENYQSQFGDNTNFAYEITIFTLPDPGSNTENEINSQMEAFRNGVKLEYTDDLSLIDIAKRRTYYEIDFPLNKIVLDSGFPLKTTEKLEALLIN